MINHKITKTMKTTKSWASKEEFEAKMPYVLVQFETINDSTYSSITKSFSNKKSADRYFEKYGNRGQEVMTRRKFNREASICM